MEKFQQMEDNAELLADLYDTIDAILEDLDKARDDECFDL